MTTIQGAGLLALGVALGAVLLLGKRHFDNDAVKVLIVTDGSVDAFTTNSDLADKDDGDQKHKWNGKAAWLKIRAGVSKEFACFEAVKVFDMDSVKQVTFHVAGDGSNNAPPPSATSFTALNEGNVLSKKLNVAMGAGWEFKRKAAGRTLAFNDQPAFIRLGSIVVTPHGQQQVETFSANGKFLCAVFEGD